MLQITEIYDVGKWKTKKNLKPDRYDENMPALHLAAASGNMEVLSLFLDDPHFNQMFSVYGETALHRAVDETVPGLAYPDAKLPPFITLEDICTLSMLESLSQTEEDRPKAIRSEFYNGKKGCMTMLLQAEIDIWQKDDLGTIAEPSVEAPGGAYIWWHEKIANDVTQAKKILNAAGNAISVVAGLVATASYVGPLQPPLGYGTDPSNLDLVQASNLFIRIFVVSSSASFYFAIASLMFAVMSSLPMSQEGLYDEWKHAQRSAAIAIVFLLMSVSGVLVSFAAASSAGMPEDSSWHHSSLSFYPTLVCGMSCDRDIIVFSTFVKARLPKECDDKTHVSKNY